MQPVYHLQSPFKTIYFTTALQGCPDLNMATNGSKVSIASTAVYHSILTCSAINLLGLRPNAGRLHQLAYYHKQIALSAARKALATKTSTYKELMTAILSLVSVDVSIPSFCRGLANRLINRSPTVGPTIIGSILTQQDVYKNLATTLACSLTRQDN